jgi:hypothetical protein
MGFFKNLFGSDIEYPVLDDSNPASSQFQSLRQKIENIAEQVQVPIEVVPADGEAYIFAGEPPNAFGVFMVNHDRVGNLKEIAEEKGLSYESLIMLTEDLRKAYIQSRSEQRFTTLTSKGKVTVTPSHKLLSEVRRIIQKDT